MTQHYDRLNFLEFMNKHCAEKGYWGDSGKSVVPIDEKSARMERFEPAMDLLLGHEPYCPNEFFLIHRKSCL